MNHKLPDDGIILAAKLPNLPTCGLVHEYGCGTARNAGNFAKLYPGNCFGFDLNPEFVKRKNGVKILQENALEKKVEENSLAVAIIGLTIFLPKSVFMGFLNKVWAGIKSGGILHIEFAMVDDHAYGDEFFYYTCSQFPDDPPYTNSFFHYCGYASCQFDHPGVMGASFWEVDEITELLSNTGENTTVCRQNRKWVQKIRYSSYVEKLQRSFHEATVQKH